MATEFERSELEDKKIEFANIELDKVIVEAPGELFKTLTTFGFLAAVMFCLGSPAIIALVCRVAGNLDKCDKCVCKSLIILAGIVGVAIVVFVLVCFCCVHRNIKAIWKDISEERKKKGSGKKSPN